MAINDPMLDPNFKFSINRFPGDGVTVTWNLNLSGGYIRREHVKAYVLSADETAETVTLAWVGPSQVNVIPAVTSGKTLVIYRDTPKDAPLVDFTDGAIISEANLDLQAKQAIFAAAEMVDRFSEVVEQSNATAAQAFTALTAAETAATEAASAFVIASDAGALATDTAAQFAALLATVEDLSGLDLSGLARLSAPQTFTAPQIFTGLTVSADDSETEFLSNSSYRYRYQGGAWDVKRFNHWDDLIDVPLTFAPETHTHTYGSLIGVPTEFPPAAHTHSYGSLTGVPSAFPPSAHTHTWGSIEGKPNVAVQGQPASFTSLSTEGQRVPKVTVSASPPSGGSNGDVWFVV